MLRALLKEMPRMGIQMGGSRQLDIAFKKIISRSPLALHPLEWDVTETLMMRTVMDGNTTESAGVQSLSEDRSAAVEGIAITRWIGPLLFYWYERT